MNRITKLTVALLVVMAGAGIYIVDQRNVEFTKHMACAKEGLGSDVEWGEVYCYVASDHSPHGMMGAVVAWPDASGRL